MIGATPTAELLAYEGFDYGPANASLVGGSLGNGGSGFAGPWLAGLDTGIPTSRFSVGNPSLTFPGLAVQGRHARVVAGGAQGARRPTTLPLGEDGTVRYVSLLVRPDANPAATAYFGLHLVGSAGADLFVGKPGGGDTLSYVLENAGGAGQVVSPRKVVTNEVVLIVLRLEFNPGNDRISLHLNPTPGSPEPVVADAVKTDLDLGIEVIPGLNGTPAWSADELRVGTTFQSVLPVGADFQLKPVSGGTVAEHTAMSRKIETVDPLPAGRTLAFEIVGTTHNAQIDPANGQFTWTPGELDGGQSRSFTVRATSNANPPVSVEVSFTLIVQETNQPPQLAVIPDQPQPDGQPFELRLNGSDSDVPIQPLSFTLINGPTGMRVSTAGILTWTPPSGLAGSFSITVSVSDNAAGRAERSFLLTITARPSVFARWIATVEGNWNNPANWDIGRVPSNTASEVFHVRLEVPSTTIRVSESFTIGSLSWASGSRLVLEGASASMEVERTLNWRGGTLSGQGRLVAGARAELQGTLANSLTLQGECQLILKEVCELQSPLHFDGNARLLIESTGTLNLGTASGGLMRMSGNPELRNLGKVQVAQSLDPRPFIPVRNAGTFTDFGSTLTFQSGATADLIQESTGELKLDPDSRLEGKVIFDAGSTLSGAGYLRDAQINGNVRGRFGFDRLTLGSTAVLRFGSGDRLNARLPVALAGRLELVLPWPAQPGPNDVFDLIRSIGGVSGAFISPSLGQRLRLPGSTGFMALDRTDDSLALVLRNYRQDSVSLDDAPLSIVLPESPGDASRTFTLPHIAVNLPEGDWAGGLVSVTITEGFRAAVDHLAFQGNPSFALTDTVSFVGPANGDQAVHFRSNRIGTARIAGNQMTCELTPEADREAVVALLGHLQYSNSELTADWYTEADSQYPKRILTTKLSDSLGNLTEVAREIGFPVLIGLRLPGSVRLPAGESKSLDLEGRFSNGQIQFVRQLKALWTEGCQPGVLVLPKTGVPGQHLVYSLAVAETHTTPLKPFCCDVTATAGTLFASTRLYEGSYEFHPSGLLAAFIDFFTPSGESLRCPLDLSRLFEFEIPPCGTTGRGAALQGDPAASASIGSITSYHALESLMKETAAGRRWVDLYRQHGPEVVRLFIAHPMLFRQSQELLTFWHPGVAALLSGRGETSQIQPLMITQLDAFWAALAEHASPGLKAVLEDERRRFDQFRRFEGVSFAEWAGILGIPIPTQPRLYISLVKRDGDRFRLALNDLPGVLVRLWRSTDLRNWAPVPSAVIERDGATMVIIDPTAPASEAFYEVRP